MTADFRNSIEAAWRRYLRSAVKNGGLTRAEQAVTITMLDLWLHHKSGRARVIHPGRERIAKKAKVTEKTVSRTFKILRDFGVLRPVARLHGEGQKPTEYRMSMIALLELCGAEVPEWIAGELTELAGQVDEECPARCLTTGGTKCPTVLSGVAITPSQGRVMTGGRASA